MKRIGFTVIAVAAIASCQTDRTFPPGPNAVIQDANHNAGNGFFFWLAPVVKQQSPATQVFSRQLSPVVTITNLCQGGGVVRTFSGADISVSNAAYHVNWRTAQDNLNPDCTYRVSVTVGTKLMGFADVDVVSNGSELKNVVTNEFIPLLDDRTLPLQFFIGVGSQCARAGSDCGEGTAHRDQNTVIVSLNGRAGVFVPAGAVDGDVTISVESSDERPCIPGLPLSVFPGSPGAVGNSCYDFRTDPPLSRVNNETGKFNINVTVGICPDADALALNHATLDLIQIFQFDAGRPIQALDNVQAPFLHCDPHFNPSFGSRRSLFDELAKSFAALISPRPLYASTNRMMFDVGAGGSTDGFSRFTWALPSGRVIDFETFPDGSPTCASCTLTNEYASRGVVFSFSSPTVCPSLTNAQLFLSSTVYDPTGGPANHSVTSAAAPTGGFCSGTTTMSFAGLPDTVRFQLRGNNDIALFPVAAFDGGAAPIPASEITRSNVTTYTSVSGFVFRQETITIIHAGGIGRVDLAMNGFIVLIDNLIILP